MNQSLHQSHPLGPLYIVTEPFDARRDTEWSNFVAWSGLGQVSEVVSLDSILCPPVVASLIDADWPHIVNENFMLNYFVDLGYLLTRAGPLAGKNLLCVFRNPLAVPSVPDGFEMLGYDLVDVLGTVSVITNCGGFPDVFRNDELNRHGLLDSLARAREIQRVLPIKYKGKDHVETHIWAISRKATA